METRTLKYFLAIAKEENMTAAANTLHVSQSALSRQMADLEARLGRTLFVRTNKQTLLTEDGMRLRQRAEEILSLIEKTEAEFLSSEDDITGEIHIGAGETRAFHLIAQAIKNTQARYPGITFSIYSANALDVSRRLEQGTLDFGLLFEPVNKERCQYLDVPYADRLGLLVSRKDPLAEKEFVTENELLSIPLLVSSRFSPDTVLSHISRKNISRLNIRGTYNLIYNASLMVEAGIGSALAIDGLIRTDADSPLVFLPLVPPSQMHTIFVWKKNHLMTKAAEVFLAEMKKICISDSNT